ncbi:MAG: tetratricopeptide repeat protein, partial [Microcystaceae cyanobacterium]
MAFFCLNSTTNYDLEAQEIETFPTQSESLSERAASSYWQGQYQDAIAIWENLLKSASSEEAATIHRYLGVAYRQVGQLGRAIESLKQASQFYEQSHDETSRARLAEVLVERARTHNEMGQSSRSVSLLEQAIELIEGSKLVQLQTSAYQALGTAYLLGGDFDRAIEAYERSRNLAAVLEQPEELVSTLNNLTNALLQRQARYRSDAEAAAAEGNETEAQRLSFLAERDDEAALNAVSRAIKESQGMENPSAVRARLNMAELSPETDYRWQARAILNRLPPSHEKANLLLNLAQTQTENESIALLEEAANMASSTGDWRTESFALGKLGYIYEKSGNYGQALQYTQQAQWAAQQVMAADSLYRWQWQAGRIYQATSQVEPAKSAYRGALATLQKLRGEIASASPEFQIDVREEVEPVYREFLGLLLNEDSDRPEELKEAIEIRNQLQLSELQSFFGDACLELKQALVDARNVLPDRTARIHSIILEDSLYTVLELPNREFHSYRVNLQASELTEEIERWRMQLVSSSIPLSYRGLSERLYDWLIRPMESDLTEIDTLIFVNDGL